MALTDSGFPEVASVQRVDVRPGDRFVVTFGEAFTHVSLADAQTIKARAAAVLGVEPDRILVMAGATLTVLSRDDAGPLPPAEGSARGGPVPLQAANPAKETT